MAKYTVNLFGKKQEVSKQTFLVFAIPLCAFWLGYIWCLCGGVYRFGESFFNSGMLTFTIAFFLFGAITINDVRYALLPENKFTKYLIRILTFTAIVYYFYNINKYGF